MVTKNYYTLSEVADMLGKTKETLRRWDNSGKLTAVREPMSNYRVYKKEQLKIFDELDFLFTNETEINPVEPTKNYSVLELFAQGESGTLLLYNSPFFKASLIVYTFL